jgi:phospholipid/cholesterol/gamma-HCH transport system permease protein
VVPGGASAERALDANTWASPAGFPGALTQYLRAARSADKLALSLTGEWRALALKQIGAELSALELTGVRQVSIATDALVVLDLSSAWRLREFITAAGQAGANVSFPGKLPEQLQVLDEALAKVAFQAPGVPASTPIEPVTELGRYVVRAWRDMRSGLAFVGQVALTAAGSARSWKHLRPVSVARHVYDTGVTAIPIVALIAFLISVIIAFLSAQQLQRFGAEIFVVDLVTIGVLRELGVLLTAIIVAGRSGSAFAAEIGAMRLNEEVDALYATGADPYELLVLPRILGLMIALPLLTVLADAIGLAGGALLCRQLLDIPITQYLNRVSESIGPWTFWVGVLKAPIFAVLIAFAGVYRGLQVTGSSRELGRLTTVAVVQSIFLVILADALFAVLFMEIGV